MVFQRRRSRAKEARGLYECLETAENKVTLMNDPQLDYVKFCRSLLVLFSVNAVTTY